MIISFIYSLNILSPTLHHNFSYHINDHLYCCNFIGYNHQCFLRTNISAASISCSNAFEVFNIFSTESIDRNIFISIICFIFASILPFWTHSTLFCKSCLIEAGKIHQSASANCAA